MWVDRGGTQEEEGMTLKRASAPAARVHIPALALVGLRTSGRAFHCTPSLTVVTCKMVIRPALL